MRCSSRPAVRWRLIIIITPARPPIHRQYRTRPPVRRSGVIRVRVIRADRTPVRRTLVPQIRVRAITHVQRIHVPQRRAVPTRVPHITRAARETPVRRLTRAQQKIRVRHIILAGQGADKFLNDDRAERSLCRSMVFRHRLGIRTKRDSLLAQSDGNTAFLFCSPRRQSRLDPMENRFNFLREQNCW